MGFQFLQISIIRQIPLKMFVLAESVQVSEYGISFQRAWVFHPQMVGVCEHAHDLFPDFIRLFRQVDTVPQRFAHFGLSVRTGKPHTCLVFRQQYLWLHQSFSVYRVKFVHDFPGLLNHGKLVFPHGNCGCLKCGNICCLADGICEKPNGNTGFKITHLNLGFYRGIPL